MLQCVSKAIFCVKSIDSYSSNGANSAWNWELTCHQTKHTFTEYSPSVRLQGAVCLSGVIRGPHSGLVIVEDDLIDRPPSLPRVVSPKPHAWLGPGRGEALMGDLDGLQEEVCIATEARGTTGCGAMP
jgi:hypothetical protein